MTADNGRRLQIKSDRVQSDKGEYWHAGPLLDVGMALDFGGRRSFWDWTWTCESDVHLSPDSVATSVGSEACGVYFEKRRDRRLCVQGFPPGTPRPLRGDGSVEPTAIGLVAFETSTRGGPGQLVAVGCNLLGLSVDENWVGKQKSQWKES